MRFRINRLLILAAAVPAMILLSAGVARAVPADVQNHWAAPAISDLMRQGILVGYPDHTFKPNRFVSRAEFARMAVRTFGLAGSAKNPFKDTATHWARKDVATLAQSGVIDGYPDGTFRPDQAITRAEMVVMLDRLMQFGGKDQVFGQTWQPSFADIPASHWAFRYVELARRLDYLPPSYSGAFMPEAVATRAETAWMLDQVEKIQRRQGTVMEVNPETGAVTLSIEGADPVSVQIDPEALILRNNGAVPLEQIMKGDKFLAYIGPDGQAKAAKVSGDVNVNDLASRLNDLTKGALTPETVTAIASGNWTAVQDGLKNILFDKLIQLGLGPGEAQSLLDRDWVTLDLLSRDQLTSALSSRLGISTDLAAAILNRDLARVKELATTEIAAVALGKIFQERS